VQRPAPQGLKHQVAPLHYERTYRITPAGRKQLEHERAAFERMHTGISRVMRPAES
jgi:DNA-binding PadR family transcriptional regulator